MMATTTCLTSSSPSSSSSSSYSSLTCSRPGTRVTEAFLPSPSPSSLQFSSPTLSSYLALSVSLSLSSQQRCALPIINNRRKNKRHTAVLALLEEEEPLVVASSTEEDGEEEEEEDTNKEANVEDGVALASKTLAVRPCELYVCNLPNSCGILELHDLFKPYGIIQSVEVSRDAETGISRGCGYVTMSSMSEAKAALSALDGSDVGGREMRIRFSADVNSKRKNLEALNSAPQKNLIFESPYKMYVGNLAWSVKPEDLRNLFSQFGTVVSARVLHDRKAGKNRVYGFLSFSSADEVKSAISLHGTEFCDRTIVVREVLAKTES